MVYARAIQQLGLLSGRCFALEASSSAPSGKLLQVGGNAWNAAACGPSSCCCCSSSSRSHSTSAGSTNSNISTTVINSRGSSPKSTTSSSSSGPNSPTPPPPPPPQQQQQQQQQALLKEVQAVRAHIFEHHIGDGRRSGRKAILTAMKGRHIADWYFTLTGPQLPMTSDEVEEERKFRVELARTTGGGPPKKGQGKRAKK